METQYCSDLHLEFEENQKFLKNNRITPKGEILLLGGDIMPFALIDKFKDFTSYLCDHYDFIYWLPGNHEYYHFDIDQKPDPLFEKIRNNFFLVNNQRIKYKNSNLVFSTLWSHISPRNEWEIYQSISDFSAIKASGNRFTTSRFSTLHTSCLSFLRSAITKEIHPGETLVVITHHVPTLLNYPIQYKNSPLTDAFAVELFELIGNTQLLTNQLGYVEKSEHFNFKSDAVIMTSS